MPATKSKKVQASSLDEIVIPELDLRTLRFTVRGTAPYVSHAWSEKARKMIKDGQSGEPKQGKKNKEGRDPESEYQSSMYFTEDGRPGMPARSFKACAVDAANDVDLQKTKMKSAFHVIGDIIPIRGSEPEMREDMVRLASGVASIAYRAMFREWEVDLEIRYNAGVVNAATLVNLFRTAGFGIGVGEGRPKSPKNCGMGWGTFDIVANSIQEEPFNGIES